VVSRREPRAPGEGQDLREGWPTPARERSIKRSGKVGGNGRPDVPGEEPVIVLPRNTEPFSDLVLGLAFFPGNHLTGCVPGHGLTK
jgi:hypothetical protein